MDKCPSSGNYWENFQIWSDESITIDFKYYGARALTSPSGDGVIIQQLNHLYEIKCNANGCKCIKMDQKLNTEVMLSVMTYIPEGYSLNKC